MEYAAGIFETICADGSLLPPTVVFNGINRQLDVVQRTKELGNWNVVWNQRGSINGNVMLRWIDSFDQAAEDEKSAMKWRLRLLDNVSCHLVDGVLVKVEELQIEIATYHSNATHEMQPYDVVAFKIFNGEFDRLQEDLNERDIPIEKLRFLGLLKMAQKKGLRDIIVRKSFEKVRHLAF
ncbi:hypothetical protein FA10DRAFT_291974 [Acaromyces ingoldii]|uniref:DDE-1 domain-containing protein n=1 Tax=Acaromyces ingoldii TaxID=215250 RepID=A0A316YB41_9BASI|nr:hypothetical protein FA10DRAFT_291974 [Acaromyces ingoldii]PWN86501.1 hypothetical protein FA10DRAFT_291974 [Acaromyces ingoldii]